MRRYGLYDTTRGLTTAAAAGGAGVLLWVATLVGQSTDGRFWAEMGIVAGAGLAIAISQVIGGWTKGLRLRVSPGTFFLAFVPVLVVVGWILMATQPRHGWYQGTFASWSGSVGIVGLVHDLALWHGVLAFGFGLVLGLSFDTVPALEPAVAAAPAVPAYGAANDPVTAEREEVGARGGLRPRLATVGPRRRRAHTSSED
jgi:hypothetical protein